MYSRKEFPGKLSDHDRVVYKLELVRTEFAIALQSRLDEAIDHTMPEDLEDTIDHHSW
jgi:hypothetical protein